MERPTTSGLLVYQLADRPMTSGLIGISAGGQTHDILIYWYICWRRDPWHPEILVYQLADRPTTSGLIGISAGGQTHDIRVYWYISWQTDPQHPDLLVYQLADRTTIFGFICLSSYTTDVRWPYHLDYIQRIVYRGKWTPKSRERTAWLIDFPLPG